MDCEGYGIGGLAVGEETGVMYHILDVVLPYAPEDKPRYLMGVGTPSNIVEAVWRGIDFFDCVMPARNARHGSPSFPLYSARKASYSPASSASRMRSMSVL